MDSGMGTSGSSGELLRPPAYLERPFYGKWGVRSLDPNPMMTDPQGQSSHRIVSHKQESLLSYKRA